MGVVEGNYCVFTSSITIAALLIYFLLRLSVKGFAHEYKVQVYFLPSGAVIYHIPIYLIDYTGVMAKQQTASFSPDLLHLIP